MSQHERCVCNVPGDDPPPCDRFRGNSPYPPGCSRCRHLEECHRKTLAEKIEEALESQSIEWLEDCSAAITALDDLGHRFDDRDIRVIVQARLWDLTHPKDEGGGTNATGAV